MNANCSKDCAVGNQLQTLNYKLQTKFKRLSQTINHKP